MFTNNRCMDMNEMPKMEMGKDYNHDGYMGMKNMENMTDGGMNMGCCNMPMSGMICPPVYECPQERCCHRQIIHEVPHECTDK